MFTLVGMTVAIFVWAHLMALRRFSELPNCWSDYCHVNRIASGIIEDAFMKLADRCMAVALVLYDPRVAEEGTKALILQAEADRQAREDRRQREANYAAAQAGADTEAELAGLKGWDEL